MAKFKQSKLKSILKYSINEDGFSEPMLRDEFIMKAGVMPGSNGSGDLRAKNGVREYVHLLINGKRQNPEEETIKINSTDVIQAIGWKEEGFVLPDRDKIQKSDEVDKFLEFYNNFCKNHGHS